MESTDRKHEAFIKDFPADKTFVFGFYKSGNEKNEIEYNHVNTQNKNICIKTSNETNDIKDELNGPEEKQGTQLDTVENKKDKIIFWIIALIAILALLCYIYICIIGNPLEWGIGYVTDKPSELMIMTFLKQFSPASIRNWWNTLKNRVINFNTYFKCRSLKFPSLKYPIYWIESYLCCLLFCEVFYILIGGISYKPYLNDILHQLLFFFLNYL